MVSQSNSLIDPESTLDPLIDYYSTDRLIAYSLLVLSSLLCNAAGIGGGPINLIIILYFYNKSSVDSLALTQVSILGGSLIASLIKASFKHPVKVNFPLIDYKLCALIIPVLMLGAAFGSLFAKILQDWIILTVLSLTVWTISFITLKKAIKMYQNETKAINGYKQISESNLVHAEPEPLRFYYILLLFSVFWLFLFTFFKSKGYVKDLFDGDCLAESLVLYSSFHLVVLVQSYFCLKELTRQDKENRDTTDEIYNNQSRVLKLIAISYVTGMAAGTLGIGGGIIMNPILLTLGFHAEVTLASCNLVVLSSSISSSLQFLIDGYIGLVDGLIIFFLSFAGSTAGILFFKKQVAKYNRMSILVFLLCAVLVLVGIIIPVRLVNTVISLIEKNEFTFALRKICKS